MDSRRQFRFAMHLGAGLLSLSCAARADDRFTYGTDYVSTLAGEIFPQKALQTAGHGLTTSVIYGHQLSPHMLIEGNLQFSIFETGVDGGTDFYQTAVMGDFVWQFRDRRRGVLTPYLLAGVGGLRDDFYPNNRDGYGAIADAGAGVVTMPLLRNGLRLRLDARYVRDFREGGHSEPRVILGLDVPLGRTEQRVEVREQTVEVTKTVQAPPVVRQLPPPASKPDADGDGVEDSSDRCPHTLRGMMVDAQGCAVGGQVFALAGVNFGFNNAQLTASDQLVLDKVSAAFVGQPSLRAEIAGHTDSVGSPKSNQLLSQKRADAVRDYLLKQGVQGAQVSSRGYGKSQLLVDPEREPADAERNRRVELRVLTQ